MRHVIEWVHVRAWYVNHSYREREVTIRAGPSDLSAGFHRRLIRSRRHRFLEDDEDVVWRKYSPFRESVSADGIKVVGDS